MLNHSYRTVCIFEHVPMAVGTILMTASPMAITGAGGDAEARGVGQPAGHHVRGLRVGRGSGLVMGESVVRCPSPLNVRNNSYGRM